MFGGAVPAAACDPVLDGVGSVGGDAVVAPFAHVAAEVVEAVAGRGVVTGCGGSGVVVAEVGLLVGGWLVAPGVGVAGL